MKNIMNVTLGIVSSIGGFLDVGAIATAALAGAAFGVQMLWVLAIGTVCVMFLTEMAGRLACVSHHSLVDAVRERCGFRYFSFLLIGELFVDLLVLAAEIGGVAVALHLVTGIDYRWFVPIVAFALWLLIWLGTFSIVQNGASLLGLITLAFVVGMWWMGPPWHEAMQAIVPSTPSHDAAKYWFLAVGIIGALFEPFMLNFYSSGAIEEKWSLKDIPMNRVTAVVGMGFGAVIAVSIVMLSALTLGPHGIQVDSYEQAALMMVQPFASWGIPLFAASLGIACFGASLQVALNLSYLFAQGLGWNWSENLRPHDDARFALVYTLAIPVGALLVVVLGDPLQITTFSMALNALLAPVIVFPLLILMNDRHYVREYRNHTVGNIFVSAIVIIAFLIALVAIPLEVLGG
jgi:Mn2+/Fe2+ NRAMP family transporter